MGVRPGVRAPDRSPAECDVTTHHRQADNDSTRAMCDVVEIFVFRAAPVWPDGAMGQICQQESEPQETPGTRERNVRSASRIKRRTAGERLPPGITARHSCPGR
ncbi:hypothetical protein FAGKG844_590011 [Frankia sp. AgKG'84/4]